MKSLQHKHRKSVGIQALLIRRKIRKYAGDYAASWLSEVDNGKHVITSKYGPQHFRSHAYQNRWDKARFYHTMPFQLLTIVIIAFIAFIAAAFII